MYHLQKYNNLVVVLTIAKDLLVLTKSSRIKNKMKMKIATSFSMNRCSFIMADITSKLESKVVLSL